MCNKERKKSRNKNLMVFVFFLSSIAQTAFTQSNPGESNPLTNSFLQTFELNRQQLSSLKQGDTIFSDLSEDIQSEITLAAITWIDQPVKEISKVYHSTQILEQSSDFQYGHKIAPSKKQDTFHFDLYAQDEWEEIERLTHVEPGMEFNLDQEEIGRFQNHEKIQKSSDRNTLHNHVESLWRLILLNRFQEYYQNGAKGIDPYYRGDQQRVYPDRILHHALQTSILTQDSFSPLLQSIQQPPNQSKSKVDQYFFCYKQVLEDRPAFILSHRLLRTHSKNTLIVERHFYVTHSYITAQIIDWLAPYQNGTLIASINDTYNDKIKGPLNGLAREIAESMLKDELEHYFENLRNRFSPKKEN